MTQKSGAMAGIGTVWTDAFYHIVHRRHNEPLRQVDTRHRDMVQTVGLLTSLAIEMDVQVVVNTVMAAMTQLIAHSVTTILNDVYQVVFAEQRQRTEDARLVDSQYLILQLAQRHGATRTIQRSQDNQTVGRGFDVMFFQQCGISVFVHILFT